MPPMPSADSPWPLSDGEVWPLSRAQDDFSADNPSLEAPDDPDITQRGHLNWVGGGCAICDENADASPIAFDEEWPNPGPPCHANCDCEVEWEWDEPPTAPTEETTAPDPLTYDELTDDHWQAWADDLTDDQKRELDGYQSNSSVNGLLRANDTSTLSMWYKDTVPNLDSAIAKGSIDRPATVFRGIANTNAWLAGQTLDDSLIGTTFSDAAFLSTTANEDVARGLVGHGVGGDAVLRLELPARFNAASMPAVNAGDGLSKQYQELLLPRDTEWKIVSIERSGPYDLATITVRPA